jgi:hypothetical protein
LSHQQKSGKEVHLLRGNVTQSEKADYGDFEIAEVAGITGIRLKNPTVRRMRSSGAGTEKRPNLTCVKLPEAQKGVNSKFAKITNFSAPLAV